ncbi:MAG TPA: hypothetical protein VMT62_09095 [Syntrophorhabdaceae bacterium]|nr:hypothetical protein [Syntrophorhabdaceae bacterium]
MGILDDIKRLGIELSEDDMNEIEALKDRAGTLKKDELVRKTTLEYYLGEYFSVMRPDVMAALERNKMEQNEELLRELNRRFDENGRRICDEVGCSSTENVGQCEYCERSVCGEHNYREGGHCCYACYLEYVKKKTP